MEQTYWQKTVRLPEFNGISHDTKVDVAIIGGGLTGVTAAYLFKKAGAKGVLIERARCCAADTATPPRTWTKKTDAKSRPAAVAPATVTIETSLIIEKQIAPDQTGAIPIPEEVSLLQLFP